MRLGMALGVYLVWASATPAAELPANTWVKLSEGGIGPKFSPGMLYSPKLKRFVLIGGAIGRYPTGGPFPYDVLSAAPGSGVWRNEFPKGSGWTPEVGPAKVPAWKGYRFSTKDEKGNVRPHMRHTVMYNQYCLDTEGNCVWAIIADHTMRLDLATMKWEDLGLKGTPRGLKWASMCYDPVNAEVVLSGGAHKQPQPEGQTWVFSTGKRAWRKWQGGSDKYREHSQRVDRLHKRVRELIAALRNHLHRTARPEAARADLTAAARAVQAMLKATIKKLDESRPLEPGHLGGAQAYAEISAGFFEEGLRLLAKGSTCDSLKLWERAAGRLTNARALPLQQPAPRLMAPMVYDPKHHKILMWGGDRWDQLSNETWIYDCGLRQWDQFPDMVGTPSPRAGHALLYLPKCQKILLVGGYTYRTSMSYCTNLYERVPFDMWTYSFDDGKWQLLKFAGKPPLVSHVGRAPVAVAAAVSEDDVVQVLGLGKTLSTWAIRVDPKPDERATVAHVNKHGGEPVRRGLCFDPVWFDGAVKTAKPEAVAAKLKALPPNKWGAMSPPRRLFNRDWGTQIFDFDRDQILHWGGGHSAYCGPAPAHYSVKLNR